MWMANTRLNPTDTFARRHIGPGEKDVADMLSALGYPSLEALADATIPASIRSKSFALTPLPGQERRPLGEFELLEHLQAMADENQVFRSFIGMGYSDVIVPGVIQRNILENPGWYTPYTPYQAEISQGRLEALLNFQTVIADLTALPLANASLLDEATAAAEAMGMCRAIARGRKPGFFVADDCHPQTIQVVRTRAASLGMTVHVGSPDTIDWDASELCGVLLQYPTTDGRIVDPRDTVAAARAAGALVVMAADLLALTQITPPGELGADIAIGSSQRFGGPMGYGGPHAAYLSTRDEYARKLPGRLVGVSKDVHGKTAYRLAIQTREQHIRRDKATSNICTAQVLLAIMASMYAVYHGPGGLRAIARRIHALTAALAAGLTRLGHDVGDVAFFDTLRVDVHDGEPEAVLAEARERMLNLRRYEDGSLGITLDETTTPNDVFDLLECFAGGDSLGMSIEELAEDGDPGFPEALTRQSDFLTHPVFHSHHSESEMLRYIHRLESRDLSLNTSMIPLGSCTMKLNATSEMVPVSWPEFSRMHPYAPGEQAEGYALVLRQLQNWLAEITGLPAVSLQPNAGSQGEYAGLLAIRRYHESRGDEGRDVCLIPVSAHGTNAASAVIAGMRCVAVACDERGNIDLQDLQRRVDEHPERLSAVMLTYPSTHGVFEEAVQEVCRIVHAGGGQVYLDGANMNPQVGLTSPAEVGADVCHLNLHKTFSIPHGGGGPGMGPIAAAEHLRAFLPGDPLTGEGAVSAAPFGSPSVLPISWTYIALMGAEGLTRATQVAILNANYMARRLTEYYDVLYTDANGLVAHEFIIDCRPFEKSAGVRVDDIAKRLMDYGFHAPTMSFPVAGTLMIEPTESEPKQELDRLCDALIGIRNEIRAIEKGELDSEDNPLKHAPHSAAAVTADEWPHPYSRELAAWPARWLRDYKFWPHVGRIDNTYGDRNLVCSCPPLEDLIE